MARRAVAVASAPGVVEVARAALRRGNAVDAVAAGIFAAAALEAGVLLGPVQILAGGAGAGLLAIDGRVLQPGRGVNRPRGFLGDGVIPDAARVGTPVLPAALATAVASLGAATLDRACGPAIALAKTRSTERSVVLRAIARLGAPALARDAIASELIAAGGRAAGGLLTDDDLTLARPRVVRCDERSVGPGRVLAPPWPREAIDASTTHVVAAADARGMVAVACYQAPLEGVSIAPLGLSAPLHAEPVMRGQTRVRPGAARPAAAPISLRVEHGAIDLAIGVASRADGLAALAQALESLGGAPVADAAALEAQAGVIFLALR